MLQCSVTHAVQASLILKLLHMNCCPITSPFLDAHVTPRRPTQNTKEFIPSLYIDRQVNEPGSEGAKKTLGNSRGYGFVEFTHHAHALACLRELNNNASYSKEYSMHGEKCSSMIKAKAGSSGKKAPPSAGDFLGEDGMIKVPRLVVEFTVENKAKANKQAERKKKQALNLEKQRSEKEASDKPKEKKGGQGRGAIQREKKRRSKIEGGGDKGGEGKKKTKDKKDKGKDKDKDTASSKADRKRDKPSNSEAGVKFIDTKQKSKKKKIVIDDDDRNFDKLVDKYKNDLLGGGLAAANNNSVTPEEISKKLSDTKRANKKRWFE